MGASSRASFANGTASRGNARSTHVSRASFLTGTRAGFPSAARPFRSSNVRRADALRVVARRRTVGRSSAPTGDAAAKHAFLRGGACAPDSTSLDTDAQCVFAARPWTMCQPCDAGARHANAEADRSSTRRVSKSRGSSGHANVDGTARLVMEDRARRRAPVSSARRMSTRGARASHSARGPGEVGHVSGIRQRGACLREIFSRRRRRFDTPPSPLS